MIKFTDDQKKLLSEKLDSSHVKPPSQFGPKGDYLEGWHVIAEANRIFGFDAWSYEVLEASCVSQAPRKIGKAERDGWGVTYTSKVRVHVAGVMREDYGAGHGYDVDAGLAHESAIKEAVTDALKRALRTFGNPFGLALYDKTRANVEDVEAKAYREKHQAAIASLWAEIEALKSERALASFWKDNVKTITGMDAETRQRFIDKKDELKAKFADDTVSSIEDTFPGSTVVNERVSDAEASRHPLNA